MLKIKDMRIGKYIRTLFGDIGIIISISKDNRYITYKNNICNVETEIGQIINCHEEIAELLEVGDYANGYMITEIDRAKKKIVLGNEEMYYNISYSEISTVATKQEFKKIEFKVRNIDDQD